mmetsp:Transcript_5986/g.10984  ORF Transcript_5986/g.10984 Transcript_5986/m.10984 type:complete len:257 (-) Transcript_5986:29-799(-)
MIIPEHLYMSSTHAEQILGPKFENERNVPSFSQFPGCMKLALLLAHERAKRDKSRWFPYIASLPPTPPNLWFHHQSREEIHRILTTEYSHINRKEREVLVEECQRVVREIEKIGENIQRSLPELGVCKDNLLWGYGMVTSRAFGDDQSEIGLAPGIDMLNHRYDANEPFPLTLKVPFLKGLAVKIQRLSLPSFKLEQIEIDPGGNWECACIIAEKDGNPIALKAFDEAMISYISSHVEDTKALFNFGFAPKNKDTS